jgi:hypothetical protein
VDFLNHICYGVDFSEHGATVVKAVRSGRTVRVEEPATALPPDVSDAAVAAVLPVQEGFTRRIVAPFASIAKARKVFASILDIQLPFPIERCVCHFLQPQVLPGGQVEALAVAARREDIEARIGKLRAASVDPTHLDAETLALWTQSLDETPLDHETLRVVLYVGHDRTALVLGRGATCAGGHALRTGARSLFGAGADGLQALALRVRQILQAQWKNEAEGPMQWALCGPGFDDARHAEQLQRALARPESSLFFVHKQPASFLARGLAIRAVSTGAYRCNFLTDTFEHPRVASQRDAGAQRSAIAALAAGLVLCALNLGWRQALSARTDSMQEKLSSLAVELSGVANVPLGQEVIVAERAAEEQAADREPLLGIVKPGPAAHLASALAAASGGGITLDSATLSSGAVVLAGRAPSWASVDGLAAALRNDGWKASVDRGDAGADERVPFTIRAVP